MKKDDIEQKQAAHHAAGSAAEGGNKRRMGVVVISCILGALVVALGIIGLYVYQAVYAPHDLFGKTSIRHVTAPEAKPLATTSSTPMEATEDNIVNVLLMGIDESYKVYAKGGGDYHTDSMIVLSINFDENKIDMISLPRDTFTHVPGVRGIYKLNAAINCGGGKNDAGFRKVCECASQMLGGISVDYYCAFELETVMEIGDLIGGIDYDLDMAYTGSSGRTYQKGYQHLDGTGIYDYMRARRNATSGLPGDKGRMDRGKRMLTAIFEKLKNENMMSQLPQLLSTVDTGLYTNLDSQQLLAMCSFAYSNVDVANLGSYTLAGPVNITLGWTFCFTDQENRIEVIREVYGVDVPEQPYTSHSYALWLGETGFKTMQYLTTGEEVLAYADARGSLSAPEQLLYDTLKEQIEQLQTEFDQAGLTMSSEDDRTMAAARDDVKKTAEELAEILEYSDTLDWTVAGDWAMDPGVNEISVNFR